MILRSCIDVIGGKQLQFTPIPVYDSEVSVVGMFEDEWVRFVHGFPERMVLNLGTKGRNSEKGLSEFD